MISRVVRPSAVRRAAYATGGSMIAQAGDDGPMKGGVGLAVATAIEAMPTGGHPGGGGDGARPTQRGEGRFRPNAIGVVPKDDEHLGGRVGADAEPLAERG